MSVSEVKATVAGVEYPLSLNSETGLWEISLTAPLKSSFNEAGGYFGISIFAKDDAGNTAGINSEHPELGADLRLIVHERQLPVISIESPGEGSYITSNTPSIIFTVLDNSIGDGGDSGVDAGSVSLSIDSGEAIGSGSAGLSYEAIEGGYRFTYVPESPLSDALHTISISALDNDKNAALPASLSFTVDTLAPSLNVTSPAEGFVTNQTLCIVEGTTSDGSGSEVTVKISLNGIDCGEVSVTEGAFSHEITLVSGENEIVITATDMAGKETSVTRNVVLNTTAPVITAVTLTPNELDCGATYKISVAITSA
ncbi:MAG: hypothetical protein IJC39_02420 [Firmicutes bacterium]|nr:hypothetical protein [Bacillota bacterium]